MKTFLLIVGIFAASFTASAQNRDLPGPTANLQTLTTGSYVIAMDNTLQTNTAGDFNLKAYGLVVHLLNNNIKVKWSIKAGKAKDGIDFTATAEQFQPALIAGGVSRDFKAGPFVIYAADTTGVAALINSFYTINSLTGSNRPRVYRLTATASNVDIRYDMSGFKPKAEILDDGGNEHIHVDFMTDCAISSSNYTTGTATDLYTKCYTFASEPHNDAAPSAIINAIKSFVQKGGNFLAQCRAVETYENDLNGRFQTNNGITVTNSNVTAASTIYPNADLAFSQYDGAFDIKQNGSVMNWKLATGSSVANNGHNHATGGTIVTQTPIGASVSKLTAAALAGGLVFYIGNHDFTSVTTLASINGIRMYMNAFLTPVAVNNNCSMGAQLPNPLPVKLVSFNANLDPTKTKANLSWTTATEVSLDRFEIERSTDGNTFTQAGLVFAYGTSYDTKNYQFADNISSLNASVIYYRLRQVDIDGHVEYSATRIIRIGKQSGNPAILITAYPNPVSNELRITLPADWQNKNVLFELYNTIGQVAAKTEISNSSQTETLKVNSLAPGFYIVRVTCGGETAQQKIIKQ